MIEQLSNLCLQPSLESLAWAHSRVGRGLRDRRGGALVRPLGSRAAGPQTPGSVAALEPRNHPGVTARDSRVPWPGQPA